MADIDDLTPEQVHALTGRLEYNDDALDTPVSTAQDTGPDLVPRSIKLSSELDRRCKQRAFGLGLSQSAYIRQLIERDLAESDTGQPRPAWVRELLAVIAHHEHDDQRKAS